MQAALNESLVLGLSKYKSGILSNLLTEYFGNGDVSSDNEEDESSGDESDDEEPTEVDNMTDSEHEDNMDGDDGGDEIEGPIC